MENNSDKQLRDKLSGMEFPFDPQAWDKMEAMLDEKKKRRGFLWWWTGGIAATLLFGVIGYELRGVIGKEQLAMTNEKSEVGSQGSEVNSTTAVEEKAKVKSEKLKATEIAAASNIENPGIRNQGSEENSIAADKEQRTKRKQETRNKKQAPTGTALISANPSNQFEPFTNAFSKGNKQTHTNKKQQTTNSKPTVTPVQQEIAMLNAVSANASVEENISLSRMEASLLNYVSENATTSFDKKEEDVLPKKKKRIFNYSVGVLANVTGTTLGKQDSHVPGHTVFFYEKPSYMVGLTHDFLFVNRVAISNSILFSQTSFEVYYPKTVNFSTIPGTYCSQITELAIPIGIKVYPVAKNNFHFYISTGIINHIKLKETFSYSGLDDTTPSNATANLFDQGYFPTQTNFGSKENAFDALNSGGMTTASNSTSDFSINRAKRYYASFYAGAGFEYMAKKHFILFGEPMYYMSLQKIGVQDKRKYNLGISGGFRYQF